MVEQRGRVDKPLRAPAKRGRRRQPAWKALLRRVLPADRVVILRRRGGGRAIKFSMLGQLGVFAAFGALLVWAGVATINTIEATREARRQGAEAERVEASYRMLAGEIADERRKAAELATSLLQSRGDLAALSERASGFGPDLTETPLRLRAVPSEDPFGLAAAELDTVSPRLDLAAARALLSRRIGELEQALSLSQQRVVELEASLDGQRRRVAVAEAAQRKAFAERDAMRDQVASAERRVATVKAQQEASLAMLTEHTRSAISQVEKLLRATGVEARNVVALDRSTDLKAARGGPFVPYSDKAERKSKAVQKAVLSSAGRLTTDIQRLDQLRRVLRALPLSSPLRDFTVTDRFGYRIDPFFHRPALHEGLDMSAERRTPIEATAPGIVLYAGWRRDYGYLVDIDHGFGIRTVYAHLDRVTVNTGAKIARGDTVGLLGATGRATGPHLHYEVRVDGRPRDPMRFLQAASKL